MLFFRFATLKLLIFSAAATTTLALLVSLALRGLRGAARIRLIPLIGGEGKNLASGSPAWKLFFAIGLSISGAPTLASTHIMIDPGHGGHDNGATRNQIHEADLVLKVSRLLAERLKKDPQFEVSLTRKTDKSLSLEKRVKMATQKKVDLFVSVHVNSSPDHRARGAEFYFQNQLPPDKEALFLANRENQDKKTKKVFHGWSLKRVPGAASLDDEVQGIVKDLLRNYRIKKSSTLSRQLTQSWQGVRQSAAHSIRQAPFFVISHVPVPSTLVELGFLSNKDEVKKLTSSSYQKQLAASLHKGLSQYASQKSKAPNTSRLQPVE